MFLYMPFLRFRKFRKALHKVILLKLLHKNCYMSFFLFFVCLFGELFRGFCCCCLFVSTAFLLNVRRQHIKSMELRWIITNYELFNVLDGIWFQRKRVWSQLLGGVCNALSTLIMLREDQVSRG